MNEDNKNYYVIHDNKTYGPMERHEAQTLAFHQVDDDSLKSLIVKLEATVLPMRATKDGWEIL